MQFDRIVILLAALPLVLLAACQVTPTPTLVPIPTATYIPTETETPAPTVLPTVAPIRAVVSDTLRVREQPNINATILGRLKKDTVVLLLARQDDNQWYVIEYPPDSGEHGWIAAGFVLPASPADLLPVGLTLPPPPPGAIFADVQHLLNVRRGPGKDFDIVGTLPAGARVTLLAQTPDGQWYQINYPSGSKRLAWILGTADVLFPRGSVDQIPVVKAPPAPTPAPTPIPRPTRTPGPPATGRILMSSNRGGGYDIFSVAEDGTIRAQLTHLGEAYGARWSPDGGRIVFYHIIATSPALVSHIYVMNADGSGLTDLSAGDSADSDPDWSPDGTRLAFVRTARAAAPEIWTMNADGSGARRVLALSVTTGLASGAFLDFSPQPRWSPDGGRIAYAAVPDTQNPGAPLYPNIFVVNANGSGVLQLTDNDLINSNPVWSPDGKQIAWSAKDFINRQNWRVNVMSAGGGNQRGLLAQLSGDPNNGLQSVEWIGNRLLLAGWAGNWNVYLANADGSGLTPVTRENADDKPTDWQP